MRLFVTILIAVASVASAQQQLDPSYLRQYYQQAAQQAGTQGTARQATPIFESQDQAQYVPQGQQLKNFPRPEQQQTQQAYVPEQQVRQYQPQPQQHQAQYQPPRAQAAQPKRPYKLQTQEEESPEDYDPSPSYQFGFDVKDDEFTNYQNRKESREGNVIKGSYSVVDSDGFIRTVTYTADPKEGFKAEVVREPTDIVIKIPTPAPKTQQPQTYHQSAPQPKQSQPQYVQPQQYRAQQQARPEYAQYQQ